MKVENIALILSLASIAAGTGHGHGQGNRPATETPCETDLTTGPGHHTNLSQLHQLTLNQLFQLALLLTPNLSQLAQFRKPHLVKQILLHKLFQQAQLLELRHRDFQVVQLLAPTRFQMDHLPKQHRLMLNLIHYLPQLIFKPLL